ncbi:hypothetical protein MMC28_002428 [Mycoblastus sanguinarius]|nr:hypothetical protein [Mycoblastus sanguinarius]
MSEQKDVVALSDHDDEIVRSRAIKVLVMGMGRTGTTSLAEALKQMGYKPYDFVDRWKLNHLPLWDEALRAKFYGKGKPWGRKEFDVVTKDFDCILDVPCCFFTSELVTAYPSAVVILNRRDPDKWLASMNASIFSVFRWPSWKLLRYTDPSLCGFWRTHTLLTWEIFCGNDYGERCRESFLKHYEDVRAVVPKERLLEWEVRDGWNPLCQFLEVDEPKEEFPNLNDRKDLVSVHVFLRNLAIQRSVVNMGKILAPLLAVGLSWWVYQARLP